MHAVIQPAKRLIIKVGSSLVTNDGKGLDTAAIAKTANNFITLFCPRSLPTASIARGPLSFR